MVTRTRRAALRDRTTAHNLASQPGPSSPKAAKRRRAPRAQTPAIDELDDRNPLDEAQTISPVLRTPSNTLPALQSTPVSEKNPKKRRRHVPYLTKLSSPLPPSSPLATSPTDGHHAGVDNNDPFGFLLVEKKLKALKGEEKKKIGERSKKKQRVYDDDSIDDMYTTDEESVAGAVFITPAATTGEQRALNSPHAQPPRTPTKRSNKRELVASSPSTPGSSTPRIPTSPSPIKLLRMARVPTEPAVKANGVGGRPRKKARAKIQQEEDEHEMDPSMIAEHLESLLPTRPARRPVRQVTGKVVNKAENSDSEERTTKRKRKPLMRVGKKKPASKGKATKKSEVSGLDEEQEKARRERIEYFKRLDEYELAKENVYVV